MAVSASQILFLNIADGKISYYLPTYACTFRTVEAPQYWALANTDKTQPFGSPVRRGISTLRLGSMVGREERLDIGELECKKQFSSS